MEMGGQLPGIDRLGYAWHWWVGELAGMLPTSLRRRFSPESTLLRICETDGGFKLELFEDDHSVDLGILPLTSTSEPELQVLAAEMLAKLPSSPRIELILGDNRIMSREIFLPQAVESNLPTVLQFESDKLTPFRKGQALIGHRIIGRHPEHSKIVVQLYCIDRNQITHVLHRLKLLDLSPARIVPESLSRQDAASDVNMLPPGEQAKAEPLWNRNAQRAGLICLGLVIAVLALPAWYLESEIETLQDNIDALRSEATRVAEKRGLVMNHLVAQQTIISRKNNNPGQLQVIAEVTARIPDNTWVSRMRIAGGKVLIQGESSKASDLIELLEQSELFSNVRFKSSVTRNPRTTLEQYQIEMDISGVQA